MDVQQTKQLAKRDLAAEVDRLTLQMAWFLHRRQAQKLRDYELTVPQFMVLRALQRQEEGYTMSQLAEEAMQVPATVTGIVDRLETQGLALRGRNPQDRRSTLARITATGRTLLDQIDGERRAKIEEFLGSLALIEREHLLWSLRLYVDTLLEPQRSP